MKHLLILCLIIILGMPAYAQDNSLQWIDFEQLEDSLNTRPKKVLIYFYTDWCTYCRKMEKEIFTKPEVISALKSKYYLVKFDAEQNADVKFDNQVFSNRQIGKSRTPIHDIVIAFTGDPVKFAPPLLLFLNDEFEVKHLANHYLDTKSVLKILSSL
jgi:thioredoxin-related protein